VWRYDTVENKSGSFNVSWRKEEVMLEMYYLIIITQHIWRWICVGTWKERTHRTGENIYYTMLYIYQSKNNVKRRETKKKEKEKYLKEGTKEKDGYPLSCNFLT
jgi:hypothetical protein